MLNAPTNFAQNEKTAREVAQLQQQVVALEKRLAEMQIRFILEVEPPVLWAQIVYVVS